MEPYLDSYSDALGACTFAEILWPQFSQSRCTLEHVQSQGWGWTTAHIMVRLRSVPEVTMPRRWYLCPLRKRLAYRRHAHGAWPQVGDAAGQAVAWKSDWSEDWENLRISGTQASSLSCTVSTSSRRPIVSYSVFINVSQILQAMKHKFLRWGIKIIILSNENSCVMFSWAIIIICIGIV